MKVPARSLAVCIASGAAYAAGWWLLIIGFHQTGFSWLHFISTLLVTLGLGLFTLVSRNSILDEGQLFGSTDLMGRVFLFGLIFLIFGGMMLSVTMALIWRDRPDSTVHAPLAVSIMAIR